MKVNPLSTYLQSQNKNALPAFMIIGACVLIGFVIFPQFSSLSTIENQISQQQNRIQNLESSIQVLNGEPDNVLNSEFTVVDSALPNNKRVVDIFNTLADSASKSNVNMKSFEVKVGSVYEQNQQTSPSNQASSTSVLGVPYLTVDTQVEADNARKVVQFINSLSTKFPLSEVKTTDINNTGGSIEIEFFYKPYNLDQLSQQDAVSPMDNVAKTTLNQIRDWQQNQ